MILSDIVSDILGVEDKKEKETVEFLTSAAVGAATGSAIAGALVGGNIAGAVLGDILDGDLFD